MLKMSAKILCVLGLLSNLIISQSITIDKVEPSNWWTGMKWDNIQLMIYGDGLSDVSVRMDNPNIKITKVSHVENTNYLFVDIELPANIEEGTYKLIFSNDMNETKYDFPIYARDGSTTEHQGFNASDVIYLITPDRFVNGDTSNDEVPGMIPDFEPDYYLGRHGGDIQGIINKLDYLKELGITAIWINPLVENNNDISYHGYATTDLYKIDSRFGTNDLYKNLVSEAHKKGLKIIYDHVSNHISINHPWIKNLPMPGWINGTVGNHLNAIHHKMALSDIHADSSTIIQLTKGWFVDSMPDLNQENPYVKNYLIQNTIWWIEFSGLDGIREDTYPYVDQKFLSEWAKAILDEYPSLNIVGEVWTGETAFLANYQRDSYFPRAFDTNLPSVTDFGMRDTYYKFLKGENNLYNIYETLSKDYLFPDPQNLVVFIDNHDVTRAMLAANGNINKMKIALTLLLTTRGIPQILYGTEIGMEGGEDHGLLRSNFPGGFPGDTKDAFTKEGRTEKENEVYDFMHNLMNIRKQHKALYSGTLTHFPPVDDIYYYFKKSCDETLLIIVNGSDKVKTMDFMSLRGHLNKHDKLRSLLNDFECEYEENLKFELNNYQVMILKVVTTK